MGDDMKEIRYFWDQFNKLQMPGVEEYISNAAENNGVLLSKSYVQDQIVVAQVYKYLFEIYLEEHVELNGFDRELQERGYIRTPAERMTYNQKYDMSGMTYIYLNSYVYTERLSDTARKAILAAYHDQDSEAGLKEAMRVVENTWRAVLVLDPERPDEFTVLNSRSIGKEPVKCDALQMGVASYPDYDKNGNLRDVEKDDERIETFLEAKEHIKELIEKSMGIEVNVYCLT